MNDSSPASPRFRLRSSVFMLGVLVTWCAALILARWGWLGTRHFAFLGWNLILAAIPYAAALAFERLGTARTRRGASWLVGLVWLLFLPNAPYLVTDLMHLGARPPVPIWFDALLVVSVTGTGVLLGCASVAIVQRTLARAIGRPWALSLTVLACMLSGFGVYLGRFRRWNSWDLVTDPTSLLSDVLMRLAAPASHPRMFAVTLLYGVGFLLACAVVQALADESPVSGATSRTGEA